ncbi:glycoside hydrolase family 88 protein [Bacteroidota bacterium]
MRRRSFIKDTLKFGAVSSVLPLTSCKNQKDLYKPLTKIEKVKRAMLCMQRNAWEQGVASHALIDLNEEELTNLFAKEAILWQHKDGRLGVLYGDETSTDPASNGEAVLISAELFKDESMKIAGEKMLNYLINKAPKTNDGILYHRKDSKQLWIDSMYMAPPFLAIAGKYKEAVFQIQGIRKILFNSNDKLYSHIWDDDKKQFIRKEYWGSGNGWTAAGITRTLKYLPVDFSSEKEELIYYLQEIIDSCLTYIRDDGLFHDIVNDSNSFIETNLSQMLAYSIYIGIKNSWLNNSYYEFAEKMRAAANKKVDEFGYVKGVCGAPYFDKPGISVEGQAFYLLMEAACMSLNQ